MSFGDFIKGIAGPVGSVVGGAIGGPPGAAIGGALLGSAANSFGGSSSGSRAGSMDVAAQQNAMIDKLLGYETPGTRFLENYAQTVFFDDEDNQYKDNLRAQNTFGNLHDAVQAGNLDPFSAATFMESKLSPTSEYYSSKDFSKLLNAEVNRYTQKEIANDAALTNFYRPLTKKENKYYRNLADSMGMNKSPMQFSSFLNSRLSNTLEAQQKGPLNSYEQAASAYYGPMVRSADGRKTGTFNVFGMPRQSFDSSDLIA